MAVGGAAQGVAADLGGDRAGAAEQQGAVGGGRPGGVREFGVADQPRGDGQADSGPERQDLRRGERAAGQADHARRDPARVERAECGADGAADLPDGGLRPVRDRVAAGAVRGAEDPAVQGGDQGTGAGAAHVEAEHQRFRRVVLTGRHAVRRMRPAYSASSLLLCSSPPGMFAER